MVRDAQRRNEHVVPSPLGLDLIEDAAKAPVDLQVDPVELLREQPAADTRDVDRLPIVERTRLEAVPKTFEHALTHIGRDARSLPLSGRRIDAQEVPHP